MKTKKENQKQNENKNENENKNIFFLSKRFCIFVHSTWPRGATERQLSLEQPRSAIALMFANFPGGLAVPQMVNPLLIDLEVPQHLEIEIWHLWFKNSKLSL